MWEFSLNFKSENADLAKYVYNILANYVASIDGVVTSNEENGHIFLLIAVKDKDKEKLKLILINAIIEIICTKFKSDFLNKMLVLPELDKASIYAFKKALLNFDKETDKFIIRKNLVLEKNLYVESFYHFKLRALQDKWEELVSLSNENKEYLISRESFIDLLKFLVDNLDICEDEISIVKEKDGYRIFSDECEFTKNLISEENF